MPTHHIKPITDKLDRIKIMTVIQGLKEGVHWIVDIKRYRKKRTIKQNDLYWSWIGIICQNTGNDKDDIHDYLREKFLPKRERKLFNITIEKPISTTELSTIQFNDYLEKINIEMSIEEGIVLLWPEDVYFQEQYNATKEYIK